MKLVLPGKMATHNGFRPAGHPDGRHSGTDHKHTLGDEIYAAADGVVVAVYATNEYRQGWGIRLVVNHAPGVNTTYNHIRPNGILVKLGQKVKAGQLIAWQGNTGASRGKHLHFELEIGGRGSAFRVDPAPYYKKDLPGTVGVPSVTPPKLKSNQRVVRKLGEDTWLNGRKDATVKSEALQRLEPGTTANFDAWKRGDKVTISGVTSDIWFRGAIKGRWFAAAGFTDRDTHGLKKINPVLKPKPTPKRWFNTPKSDIQYYYKSYTDALNGRYNKRHFLPAKSSYEVLENTRKGPLRIKVAGLKGPIYVGTRRNPAKIEKKKY